MREPLWTEEDWRRWRKQGVNVALVGVAFLILGPFLLFASLNLVGANPTGAFVGWLFTMIGMTAVVAGYWAYDHYGRKLQRPAVGAGQR